jgi:hypothetical protein
MEKEERRVRQVEGFHEEEAEYVDSTIDKKYLMG